MSAALPSSADLKVRLELALAGAREAGNLTLRYFQQSGVGFERKADQSPVTIADREAEELLRQRIVAQFPDDAILGEEWGEIAGTSGFRWILDPIDGTKSFITGVPLYSTLVGVEFAGRSVIGIINIPALGELVYAALGQGAWYVKGDAPPQAARVSQRPTLAQGTFLTSQVDLFTRGGAPAVFDELSAAAYVTRTWGDGYGYLLVATGRAEAMVDPLMNVWDCAALAPVLEEAGGTFTDWSGTPTIHGGEAVATNGCVLEEVLAITRPFARGRSPRA